MRASSLGALTLLLLLVGIASAARAAGEAEGQPPQGIRRVVFVGDSITYAGQYINYIEAYLRIKNPQLRCEFLDLGLPSETVSGLSEPGHAGGQFPRPELRERLDRVLDQTRPGLVVACYGMNDGIYYPFSEERFAKFQEGMKDLRTSGPAEASESCISRPLYSTRCRSRCGPCPGAWRSTLSHSRAMTRSSTAIRNGCWPSGAAGGMSSTCTGL